MSHSFQAFKLYTFLRKKTSVQLTIYT